MKQQICILMAIFLFLGAIFSINAQDLIVLRDGNIIEAKVLEISSSEIRYKRFAFLDGPTIVIEISNVLSIRYENGMVDVFNTAAGTGQERLQENLSQGNSSLESTSTPQSALSQLVQYALNQLPAIPIAGNNLKFLFDGDRWVATVNGENFSTGTIEFEDTISGYMLTLKQTHIWPGAVGRTAGNIASRIPGGAAVGGALNTAGSIAEAAGAIEAPGVEIVLEYIIGPPASLRLVSSSGQQDFAASSLPLEKAANAKNNWISLEMAVFGFGARYERMLSYRASLGVSVYGWPINFFPISSYFEINAFIRVYPTGKTFFLGLGLGYYRYFNLWDRYNYYDFVYNTELTYTTYIAHGLNGFVITPEIGWKIDVGQAGGFYLMPSFSIPIVISKYQLPSGSGWRFFYLGIGLAF
ncbi:MAG: hypothetical protein LBI14_04785 [Treponema sp.]|nr:hypothetical protein [Treponema sp.]